MRKISVDGNKINSEAAVILTQTSNAIFKNKQKNAHWIMSHCTAQKGKDVGKLEPERRYKLIIFSDNMIQPI